MGLEGRTADRVNDLLIILLAVGIIFGISFSISKPAIVQAQAQANAGIFFNIGLKRGDSHPQVKLLQKFLNANGFTIADWGAGSVGSETELFGTQTEKALKAFQCAQNISCSGSPETNGYGTVGPATRAKLNLLLGNGANSGLPTDSQVLDGATGPTLSAKANAELDALVSGAGRGQFYIYENNANTLLGALKPNPNSWTNKLDFTGVMTWQDEWKDARKPGTLITPQFMIQASHYKLPIGTKVRFSDKTGAIEERTITDSRFITGSDQQIVKLDRPLPTDRFKVYKLLSFSDANSLIALDPVRNYDKPAVLVSPTLAKYPINDNLKILTLNQDRAVMIGVLTQNHVFGRPTKLDGLVELTDVNRFHNIDSKYVNPNFAGIRDGDSGSPMFIVYNNELVLMSAYSFAHLGDFYSYNINKINATIAEMGSADRVGIVSTSGFVRENSMPLFTVDSKDKNLQVVEKTAAGTFLGRVTANDIDISVGQTITYSIVGGSGKDYFDINNNGDISVKNSASLDLSSPILKSTAGVTSGTVSSLRLKLFIKAEDNGTPRKADYLYDDNIMKEFSAVEVEVKSLTPGQITPPPATDTTGSGASTNPKTISITSPITRSQILSTTPLNFSYQVTSWPSASVNVTLIPYNADGIEIRGGVNSLVSGSLTSISPTINGRTGTATYNQLIPQTTIDQFDTRARILGASMSGGLKLPIKYKVKICGSGTDSVLCAISNESFTLAATPAVVTPPPADPVIVTVTNSAPVLQYIGSKIIAEGALLSININAADPNNDSLSYSVSNMPAGANFNSSTRTFTFTPTLTQSGSYSPTFIVSDGKGGIDNEVVLITVTDKITSRNTDTDGDGKNDEIDACPSTPTTLKTSVNTYGCVLPKVSSFDIRPTMERDLNIVKNLELGKTGVGKVRFGSDISLTRSTSALDIDTNLKFYPKKVVLISSVIPELNKPATITLYNITETTPKIMRDGVECKAPACIINSYSGGTIVFTVTGFSTYEVVEGAVQNQTPVTYLFGVNKSGTGTGTISGPGISCGIDCSENVNNGSSVVLTATPASGSVFTGWSTGCSGAGICSVVISSNTNVNAVFDIAPVITTGGGGSSVGGGAAASSGGGGVTTGGGAIANTNQTQTQSQAQNQTQSTSVFCQAGESFSPVTGQRCTLYSGTGQYTEAQLIAQNQQSQQSTGAASTYPYGRNLTIGNRGDDVTNLQNFLIGQGYLASGNNTGYFGQATRSALASWQASVGISPAEGYFGTVTRSRIRGGQAQSSVPTYTPPTQNQNQGQGGVSTTFTRNLTIGSRGADVTALQNLLISKGFLSSDNNTGYFGTATRGALARWQASVGISPAEGYFGTISRAAMR